MYIYIQLCVYIYYIYVTVGIIASRDLFDSLFVCIVMYKIQSIQLETRKRDLAAKSEECLQAFTDSQIPIEEFLQVTLDYYYLSILTLCYIVNSAMFSSLYVLFIIIYM